MTYSNNKSTTYVYDATGRKLQVEYVNPATTFDYCGNVIYANGRLYRILVDGGYIEPYEGEMYYSYYLKDHQGNNRVVAYDNGIVSEVNHYYPFGLLFGESKDPETQKFKYNGKEYDRYHGLDMYDYGARFYDPGICRFTTMDPMCEKYYHLSPYIYCGNNPVNAIDMKGDTIIYIHDNTQYYYMMKGDASGFYDKQGNMLKNQGAYELSGALQEIQSGEMGNKLVSFLSNSTKNVSIRFAMENETHNYYNSSTVNWNPTENAVGMDENFKQDVPAYISLAHELFHVRDNFMFGNKEIGLWYKTSKGGNISMKEYYTSLNENLIRAEHGLPLRQYYSDKPYLPSYIPKCVLPFSVLIKIGW